MNCGELIDLVSAILTTHVGEVLGADFVGNLTKFLTDESEASQTRNALAVIEQEYPVIWADPELGELAAAEIARISAAGFGTGRSRLDVYRLACKRLMSAIAPRPEGVALH